MGETSSKGRGLRRTLPSNDADPELGTQLKTHKGRHAVIKQEVTMKKPNHENSTKISKKKKKIITLCENSHNMSR